MRPSESILRGYDAEPADVVDVLKTEAAPSEQSDLRELLSFVRRNAVLIVVTMLVVGAATYGFSRQQTREYTAESTLLYAPSATVVAADQDPARAIETIAGIAASTRVLDPVAADHHIGLGALKKKLTVTGDNTADLIKVAVTTPSPTTSAGLANAVANALIAYRSNNQKALLRGQATSLEQQLRHLTGRLDPSSIAVSSALRTQLAQVRSELLSASPDVTVLTPASTPKVPSAPHPTRNGAIGLLVGLVLGILLALFRERLDRRIRSIDEVESIFSGPLLGIAPFSRRRMPREKLLADFSSPGVLADAYRTIRTNLSIVRLNGSATTVLLVTSAVAGEGKSAVAANVGHALSVMGKKVLVISADLHNPALHEYFTASLGAVDGRRPVAKGAKRDVPRGGGLVQVLGGEMPLAEAIRRVPLTGLERGSGGSLAVLADETRFFDPAVLFNSGAMRTLLNQARQDFDVIILDTPPVLANSDAVLLAQLADAVLVVARVNHLTRNQARRAHRIMSTARIKPIGVVACGDLDSDGYGYGYAEGYGYRQGHDSEHAETA